jgi:DNA repair protein RadC
MAGIKFWNEDDRPREKMLLKGVDALSNSELLAILINNGLKDKSAVDLAKDLLHACNNDLVKLSKLSVQEIIQLKIKGIGPAKAVTIAAALQLSSRRDLSEVKKQKIISSDDIAHYLKLQLQFKQKELFVVVYLNTANNILHHEIISEGGITGTVADPRIILKKALEYNATGIILSHNHPSGNLKPSKADEVLTAKIKEAAAYLDIKVLDHIIVSDEGYFSFADEGMI